MRYAYLVEIEAAGFRDTVLSLRPTVKGAVGEGVRWFRRVAAYPNDRPTIVARPVVVVSGSGGARL